jgi:arylsulfatase
MSGNLPTAWHKTPSWPLLVNLRRDPYERFMDQSEMYMKWWADRMFVMVPAQVIVGEYLESLKEFPPARGSSLSISQVLDSMTTGSKTTQ